MTTSNHNRPLAISIRDIENKLIEVVVDLPQFKEKACINFIPQGSTVQVLRQIWDSNPIVMTTERTNGLWQGQIVVNTKPFQKGNYIVHVDVEGLHYFSNWSN